MPAADKNRLPATLRTALELLLTVALCVIHNFIGVRSYILLDHYSGYADHFNTIGVIFTVWPPALLLANPITALRTPPLPLLPLRAT